MGQHREATSQVRDLKPGLWFDLRWGSGFRKAPRAAVTDQFSGQHTGPPGDTAARWPALAPTAARVSGHPQHPGQLGWRVGQATLQKGFWETEKHLFCWVSRERDRAPKTHRGMSHPQASWGEHKRPWLSPTPLLQPLSPCPSRSPTAPLHRLQRHSLGYLPQLHSSWAFTQQPTETQI